MCLIDILIVVEGDRILSITIGNDISCHKFKLMIMTAEFLFPYTTLVYFNSTKKKLIFLKLIFNLILVSSS